MVEVKMTSEVATVDRPAHVEVFENGVLVAKVVAQVVQRQGADGGQYPVVVLEREI